MYLLNVNVNMIIKFIHIRLFLSIYLQSEANMAENTFVKTAVNYNPFTKNNPQTLFKNKGWFWVVKLVLPL